MLVNIGKGIELDCPDTFTADVTAHIMRIGLRNILMDSHANVTADKAGDEMVEQSRAVAEKKLAALVAGDLRTSSTREGDPVRREAIKLALDAIHRQIRVRNDGKSRKVSDYDAKVLREKAVAASEKFMVQARKNVEAARAIDVEIDLD